MHLSPLSSLPLLLVPRAFSFLATKTTNSRSFVGASRACRNSSIVRRMNNMQSTSNNDLIYPTVSDFLKDAASSLTAITKGGQMMASISLGNPAGDADSIIGAIALAYIDSIRSGTVGNNRTTPIVSIPRESLTHQRPETKHLLQQLAKIDLENLIAIDSPHLPTSASVSLVDHNYLTLEKPDWTVTSILDHHLDDRQHLDSCSSPERRNVAFDGETSAALVASTCTLMVERFPSSDPFPPSLSILLLGVILLDSVNLSPKAGKVTPRDEAAVHALLDRTNWSELSLPKDIVSANGRPDLTKLFDTLQNQKFAQEFWNSLTLLQAFKLDFKSFNMGRSKAFGVASVLQTMDAFMEKHDWMNAMDASCQEFVDKSEIFVTMFFSFTDGNGNDTGPQRQLAVMAKSEKAMEKLAAFLKSDSSLQLEEVKRSKSKDVHLVCFKQGNPKASRKQVAPILINYFKSS